MAKLELIESDYISAKKKNNKIRMKALQKIIRTAKLKNPNPSDALIEAVVINLAKEIQTEINNCPKTRTMVLDKLRKELQYYAYYAPTIIINKEVIKGAIKEISKKCNVKINEENRSVLNALIVKILYMRVDLGVANQALDELIQENQSS